MPVYEYQCNDCGVRFERRQHVTDEPETVCPECGGKVRRLFQPVGIVFKGKGFYVTDNRARSSTSKQSAKKGTSGESKSSTESKSSGESSSPGESNSPSESSSSSESE